MENHALEELARGGAMIGMLVPALVIVVRNLKEQYECRIASLEKRTEECERDRMRLNIQVQEIWQELYESGNAGAGGQERADASRTGSASL